MKHNKSGKMMHGNAGSGIDIFTLFLLALGLHSTGVEFMGGVALALAGAFSASRILAAGMVKSAKPLGVGGTITTGFFVSVVMALLAERYLPELAIQLPMAVGGFLSSFIAPFFLKVAAGVTSQGDAVGKRLVDRVLPGEDGDE